MMYHLNIGVRMRDCISYEWPFCNGKAKVREEPGIVTLTSEWIRKGYSLEGV